MYVQPFMTVSLTSYSCAIPPLQELLLGENRIAELDMAVLAGYTVLVLLELRGNALTQ